MKMKYYAVIDTNVLVSAMLKWNSVPGSIVELAISGTIVPVVNDIILSEYRDVLSRPKFHLTKDIIFDILESIKENAIFVDEEQHMDIELPDEKDRVFYEVVMEERKEVSSYLVTGNIKHFPEQYFIVTPREMLDIILGNMERN
jgi:putative PIN family toxin of toxin-antitoxin system